MTDKDSQQTFGTIVTLAMWITTALNSSVSCGAHILYFLVSPRPARDEIRLAPNYFLVRGTSRKTFPIWKDRASLCADTPTKLLEHAGNRTGQRRKGLAYRASRFSCSAVGSLIVLVHP